jgi:hypothetical protein
MDTIPAAIASKIGPIIPKRVIMAMSIPFPALLLGSPKHVAQAKIKLDDKIRLTMIPCFKNKNFI